jgi:hypothetical protein
VLGGKPIVITECFAFLNIALGDNPDGALGEQDVTAGITGVIDVAGGNVSKVEMAMFTPP